MDAQCPVEETKLPFDHNVFQHNSSVITDTKQIMPVQNYPETQASGVIIFH